MEAKLICAEIEKPKRVPKGAVKFVDRCKAIDAAGFLPPDDGMTVAKLLKPGIGKMPENEVSRKFWQIHNHVPCLGHSINTRRTHGTYYDFDYWRRAYCLRHGITHPRVEIKDVVNPPPKTNFQQSNIESDEKVAHYLRHAFPVGKSQTYHIPPLPDHLDREKTTFGDASIRDPLPPIVNPRKTRETVEIEAVKGHELYRKTHESFWPGEQINRKYFDSFDAKATMGIDTHLDKRGLGAKRGAQDGAVLAKKEKTPLVSFDQWDYEDQWKVKLGRPLQPNRILKQVGDDFVFGHPPEKDPTTVKMLVHDQLMYPTSDRNKIMFREIVSNLRKTLHENKFFRFEELMIAFYNEDKKCQGKIHANEVRKILHRFNILFLLDPKLLNDLMEYCVKEDDCPCEATEYNRCIDYVLFHACLNFLYEDGIFYYDKQPKTEKPKEMEGTKSLPVSWPTYAYQPSNDVTHLQKPPAGDWSTKEMRYYGVPSVRYDLKMPKVRKVHDTQNYGDQPSVQKTITPSAFGRRAIPDLELYRIRPKLELQKLFNCAGFGLTDEQFDQLYDLAAQCDPNGCGQVSVESFRSALKCHCCIKEGSDGKTSYECCFNFPDTAATCPGHPRPPKKKLPTVSRDGDRVELMKKRASTDLATKCYDDEDPCRPKPFARNPGLEEDCPFTTRRLKSISPNVIHGVM